MEPLAILREAEQAGLKLRVEGDKLVISGPREAEPIVRRLAEYKAEVMAALATDWRRLYSEAITELGTPHRAWSKVATAWYVAQGTPTPGDLCAGCGRPLDGAEALDLWPHGERAHAGDRYKCTIAYGRRWKAAAARALSAIGIPTPAIIAAELLEDDNGPAAA
jgi:hypothetical protein